MPLFRRLGALLNSILPWYDSVQEEHGHAVTRRDLRAAQVSRIRAASVIDPNGVIARDFAQMEREVEGRSARR